MREIDKLAAVGAIGLPAGLFADASEKLVEAWRSRAARSYPSDLREASPQVRLTLLAALCWMRATEITDALVDLLIALILKVNTRADKRGERELTEDLRRVRGKEGILFRLAEAAVENPDKKVRTALYPVVGEKTLRELVREAKANERAFQARVRTVLRGSYSNHYRRMLPPLLAVLEFGCNNTVYRPVMQGREIYVVGGNRWRNPEDDLPGDFETSWEVHYAALRQPTDPTGDEVVRRWGTLDLLDVLKDSEFLADFTAEFTSVASREALDRGTLRRRLLLCLFALGTKMGIKAIMDTGEHGETEAALRHVRRHFITRDNLRRAIAKLVNATFEARDPN